MLWRKQDQSQMVSKNRTNIILKGIYIPFLSKYLRKAMRFKSAKACDVLEDISILNMD